MKVFVLTPLLIISWWSYHDGHTLMIKSWLSYHDDHEVVMILMIIRSSFWCHFGVLLGGFWSHFGATLSSKIVLEALWELCSCWKSIFQVLLRPFWKVLESFWGSFWRYFAIFCRYKFHNGFLYDFKMIFVGFWYPLDKQKWPKSMEGGAKIKLSCCLLSNAFASRFGQDFGSGLGQFWVPLGL